MKLSKKATTMIGCVWLAAELILLPLQIVFLTMKFTGSVDWSWWRTLIPIFCAFGIPIAVVTIAAILMLPKALSENIKRSRRIDAEAEKYGMERKPGESDGDLKKRIVRRNMIVGDYSRKAVKDAILTTFPRVGCCPIHINNQRDEIYLIPRLADTEMEPFSDEELQAIAELAAQYIPANYKVTILKAEEVT